MSQERVEIEELLDEKDEEISRLRAALEKYGNEKNWRQLWDRSCCDFEKEDGFRYTEKYEPWLLAQEALNEKS